MKIINTIEQLLKWQQTATIAEIARIAEMKQSKVLEVLNNNLECITKNRKGQIIAVDRKPFQYTNEWNNIVWTTTWKE